MGPSRSRGRPRHPDVLTPAEWRVADAVRHGLTNRQIASQFGVSLDAVKFHVANAVAKLGVAGRGALRDWPGVPLTSALAGAVGGSAVDDVALGPIGQVSRPVSDIEEAVRWYRDVLGLPHLYTFGNLAFFDCAGTRLFLSAERERGTDPTGPAAEPSILYFRVGDIHRAQEALAGRGVVFRGAPHMIHRHASGMEEWMAFFDDLDHHPLALMSQVG